MSYPTCAVRVRLFDPVAAAPIAAQPVVARLSNNEVFGDGVVIPRSVTQTTDDDGQCTFHLFPNALGRLGSYYTFTVARDASGERRQSLRAYVPDQAEADLENIVLISTAPPVVVAPDGGEAAEFDIGALPAAGAFQLGDLVPLLRAPFALKVEGNALYRAMHNIPEGLVWDGVTDNTAAIQAKHDQVLAGGGGTVYIPANTGKLGIKMLVWHPIVNFICAGRNLVWITGLNITASAPPYVPANWEPEKPVVFSHFHILARARGTQATQAIEPKFSGFHFDGRKSQQTRSVYGFFAESGKYDPDYGIWGGKAYGAPKFEQVEVDACSGVGIWIGGDRQRLCIQSTRSINNGEENLVVFGNDPVIGPHCGFGGGGRHSVKISGCSGVIMFGNNCWGNGAARSDQCLAMYLRNVNGAIIFGNKFNDTIYIDGAATNQDRAILVSENYFNPLDAIVPITGPNATVDGEPVWHGVDPNTGEPTVQPEFLKAWVAVNDYLNCQVGPNTYSRSNETDLGMKYLVSAVSGAKVHATARVTSDPVVKSWASPGLPFYTDGPSSITYDFSDSFTSKRRVSAGFSFGLALGAVHPEGYDLVIDGLPTLHKPHLQLSKGLSLSATRQALSEGLVYALSATRTNTLLGGSAPVNAATLVFPAPVTDGHYIRFRVKPGIVAATLQATAPEATTANPTPTVPTFADTVSSIAANTTLEWLYDGQNNTWNLI